MKTVNTEMNKIQSIKPVDIQKTDSERICAFTTRSNAKAMLKDLENDLYVTESKYNEIKRNLNYTKLCYEGDQATEYNTSFIDGCHDKCKCTSTISIPMESLKGSSKSYNVTNSQNCFDTKGMKLTSPRINVKELGMQHLKFQDKCLNMKKQSPPIHTYPILSPTYKIHTEDYTDDVATFLYSHRQQQSITNVESPLVANELKFKNNDQQHFSSKSALINKKKENTRKHESFSADAGVIHVKRQNIVKNTKFDKKYKTPRNSVLTHKKSSISKVDESVDDVKTRKKKNKLKRSTSKNIFGIIASTSIIGKKDKKRKLKSRRTSSSSKLSQAYYKEKFITPHSGNKQMVEIYHNNKLRNDTFSTSSIRNFGEESADYSLAKIESSKSVLNQSSQVEHNLNEETFQQENMEKSLNSKNNFRLSKRYMENNWNNTKFPLINEEKSEDYNIKDELQLFANSVNLYDTNIPKRYELPTISSRMKQVDKSYFNRCTFKSIPFVVATSTSPSHNLGLNIQQVLGLMKNKVFVMDDSTSLLIKKMSKKTRLQDCSTLKYQTSILNCKLIDDGKRLLLPLPAQPHMFNKEHCTMQHTYNATWKKSICLKKEQNMMTSYLDNEVNNILVEETTNCNKLLKTFAKRRTVNVPSSARKLTNAKHQNKDNFYVNTNQSFINTTDIQNVFIKLHDQFEELMSKHEKLQHEVKKSSNPGLLKDVSDMERQLVSKEKEINVFVHLYKEVMNLKQQMNLRSERNSLVCITTEVRPPLQMKPRTANINMAQFFKKPTLHFESKPTNTFRLTTLLRQLQTFQKHLQ